MNAIVYSEYGPPEVLRLKQINKPKPTDDEILIRIHATAVNSGDWHVRKADPFAVRLFFGLMKPKKQILGGVVAGVVEEVGKEVSLFREGDRVFGSTGMKMGGYAEYICLTEKSVITLMPHNLDFEEAAAIPFGANTALHFLRKANIRLNDKVLIYGASGAVGSAAVQLAKYFGAEVTAVCSGRNIDRVKSLGADKAIDYTREDIMASNEHFDVIFEAVGKRRLKECLQVLMKQGVLLMGSAGLKDTLMAPLISLRGQYKIVCGVMSESPEDMHFIRDLIDEGALKPVIDRTYDLEEIQEAHHYVEKGHKSGNVVVRVP